MKYSLTNRQDPTYLAKADEILIEYRDRKAIPDYAEKYPQAALVVDIHPTDMPINLADIKDEIVLSQGRLTLSIPILDLELIAELKEKEIPFMYAYPATNAWELKGLCLLGVSQIRVDGPLFFDRHSLKSSSVPLRIVPNVAHENYIPSLDGTVGTWIRPEDAHLYEDYITTFEFRDIDKKKEQALYRIYSEQKVWPGPLNMLITNIGNDIAVNRLIPQEFTKKRLNCGQRCMTTGSCRLCWRYLNLANPELIENYIEATQNKTKSSEQ